MSDSNQAPESSEPEEQPFISHLLELRDRLLRSVLAVLLIFLALFYFANDIYTFVAGPLMHHLPVGTSMVAIDPISPLLTPLKLVLVASVFLAMPVILWQAWAFIAPGLYTHERRLAVPLIVSSVALFYAGMAFAYYVVLPLVFAFLTGTAPQGVEVMTDITRYLDFVLTLFFAFGVAFEVPVATVLLVWAGVTTPDSLASKRPYVVVGAFVIGMVLTPPDIISQTLLAIPMWILFEVGVFFSRWVARDKEAREEAEQQDLTEEEPVSEPGTGPTQAETQPYRPMSEAEMDAELDRIDAEENERNSPRRDDRD
jgi:sec-independent protein translocase protein TatC